jgi:hypothetical protein
MSDSVSGPDSTSGAGADAASGGIDAAPAFNDALSQVKDTDAEVAGNTGTIADVAAAAGDTGKVADAAGTAGDATSATGGANAVSDTGDATAATADEAPKGARGASSNREFDSDKAGGPIVPKSLNDVRITHESVDQVQAHLDRFGQDPFNDAMMLRQRAIADGKLGPTVYDKAFNAHELDEYQRYQNMGYKERVPPGSDARRALEQHSHDGAGRLPDVGNHKGPSDWADAQQPLPSLMRPAGAAGGLDAAAGLSP